MIQPIDAACLATALFVSGVVAPAAGQSPTDERIAPRYVDPLHGLSMEEALATGLQREPGLLAARTDIDAARGMRRQAELRPNPTVSVIRQEQISGPDNTTTTEVELPLDLFRRGSRVATAERVIEMTEYSVLDRQRMLAAEIRAAYGDLAAAARDLEVSDDLVAATRRSYELLRARVDEGASPPLERNMVEVELHRIESQRLLQAGRAEAALIELKRLLGVGSQEPLTVRDTLDTIVARETPATAPDDVTAAVAERADVREADARLRLADARIEQARSEGRFDLGLYGSYMHMDFSFPQRALGPSGALEPVQGIFNNLAAGAKLTVPLLNRNQGAIAAAQAERAGAEHLRHARTLAAESEVASAMARDEHARRAVAIYASGARALARQNLDVVRQTYELGRSTLSEVLLEQRRYLEVEMGYTEALRAAFDARTALKRALGEMK
ncbi:MAG: TolC family protein [Vicinamibacteria bacterium]